MKNPLRLLAGSLLAALSVAAAPAQLDWPEPSYGGKTTGAWLDEYGAGPGGYKPSPEADDALRHIGVSAAPRLLELLHATNSNPAAKIPASWDHWKAYLGFQALGPLGKAAIPDLEETLATNLFRIAQEAVDQLQLDAKYMQFDLEATRRERDELQRELPGNEEAQ